jgi:phosphoribosylformylglycinamidine synthase subunit PurS
MITHYNSDMKARVHVSFKSTVLDPQGQTIQKALQGLGHKSIAQVRQGKYFEIEIPGGTREQAERELDQIARDVLANPVMEDYQVEFLD